METQVTSPVVKNTPNGGCKTGCIFSLATIGLLGLISVCCVVTVILLGGVLIRDFRSIQDDILQPICKERKEFTKERYEKVFTNEYKAKYSFEIAKSTINDIFYENFNCDDINISNVTEIFTKKVKVDISKQNSSSQATIRFSTENGRRDIQIELKSEGDLWRIDEILEAAE